ncbi:MAG: flagellar assembly protein FliW [Clostridia bacterium]|jgi:flagellar assembly factor FliW
MDKDELRSIKFVREIYGFENIKDYVLANASEKESNPFKVLKASDGSVSFILLEPNIVDEAYNPVLDQESELILKMKNKEDIQIYGIVVIPNNIKEMTINLRSPIIINRENGNAIQLILQDERYSVRHRIFDC